MRWFFIFACLYLVSETLAGYPRTDSDIRTQFVGQVISVSGKPFVVKTVKPFYGCNYQTTLPVGLMFEF